MSVCNAESWLREHLTLWIEHVLYHLFDFTLSHHGSLIHVRRFLQMMLKMILQASAECIFYSWLQNQTLITRASLATGIIKPHLNHLEVA